MNKRTLVFALVSAALAGCASSMPRIEMYGGMREVLREGHVQRRIAVAQAVARPHAYAVGALENLGGEITIVDGEVWIARTADGTVRVSGPQPAAEDAAALLILAHVENSKATALREAAADEKLESALAQIARDHGVDVDRPFPFEIEGELTELSMHVIDGNCPMAGASATESGHTPWRFTLDAPAPGRIVGFFAQDAAGEITHHGTSIHAHALLVVNGTRLTGHVDRLAVAAGAAVRVAAVK